jgi:hypothetical protein
MIKKAYFYILLFAAKPQAPKGGWVRGLDNLEMIAKFFNVNKHIIRYSLNSGKSLILPIVFGGGAEKEIYFKRSISL